MQGGPMASEKMGPRESALRENLSRLKAQAEEHGRCSIEARFAWNKYYEAESRLRVACLEDALDKAIKLLSDATLDEYGFRAREYGQVLDELRAVLDEK